MKAKKLINNWDTEDWIKSEFKDFGDFDTIQLHISDLSNLLNRYLEHQNKECKWTKNNDAYETECGNIFEFTNGSPQDNGAKFCQYCGGIIK